MKINLTQLIPSELKTRKKEPARARAVKHWNSRATDADCFSFSARSLSPRLTLDRAAQLVVVAWRKAGRSRPRLSNSWSSGISELRWARYLCITNRTARNSLCSARLNFNSIVHWDSASMRCLISFLLFELKRHGFFFFFRGGCERR